MRSQITACYHFKFSYSQITKKVLYTNVAVLTLPLSFSISSLPQSTLALEIRLGLELQCLSILLLGAFFPDNSPRIFYFSFLRNQWKGIFKCVKKNMWTLHILSILSHLEEWNWGRIKCRKRSNWGQRDVSYLGWRSHIKL